MSPNFETRWEKGEFRTFSQLEAAFSQEQSLQVDQMMDQISNSFSKIRGRKSLTIKNWSNSCFKTELRARFKKCRTATGRDGSQRQKCREAHTYKKKSCIAEVFNIDPKDSAEEKQVKTEVNRTITENFRPGFEVVKRCFCEQCQSRTRLLNFVDLKFVFNKYSVLI